MHPAWMEPMPSGPASVQLRLQFPDAFCRDAFRVQPGLPLRLLASFRFLSASFCLQPALAFFLGDALHLGQVHDGPARLEVVPLQPSVLPAQVQFQHLAVALQAAVGPLRNLDRLVAVAHQPIAGQPHAVVLAGLVEAPVLGDAQGGIVGRLVADIDAAGGAGGDLQDEVGPCSEMM